MASNRATLVESRNRQRLAGDTPPKNHSRSQPVADNEDRFESELLQGAECSESAERL